MEGLVGSLVELIWDDAQFWGTEVEPETLPDECVMHTYGRIVRETDKSLYVAGEVQTEPEAVARAVTRVPRAMILDIRTLSDTTTAEGVVPGRRNIPGFWHDPTCSCGARLE